MPIDDVHCLYVEAFRAALAMPYRSLMTEAVLKRGMPNLSAAS